MEIGSNAWARFKSVKLDDHKAFKGSNEIMFNRGMTVIAGPGGSGKTTIFNLLAAMGPEVTVEGNQELLGKYGRFFFIDSENAVPGPGDAPWNGIPCGGHRFSAEIMTRDIFQEIVALKPGKARLHGDLDSSVMAGGEKRSLLYAETFAALQVIKMDLPVVIDSPFGMLDAELRKEIAAIAQRTVKLYGKTGNQ
jgi:ABC-type cobalamin/Fe3+-siderophores transport system ATPase subunit